MSFNGDSCGPRRLVLHAISLQIEEEQNFTPRYISSTTTLRTTTTTTEKPKEPLSIINGIVQHTDPEDPIFEGCNSEKACFGLPAGCVKTQKCQLIVAYKPDRLDYHFEMKVDDLAYD